MGREEPFNTVAPGANHRCAPEGADADTADPVADLDAAELNADLGPFNIDVLRAADRLFRRVDPPTKQALVDAFAQDKLRLGNRAPRTKAEHALFRLAKQRRDLRQRIRVLRGAYAACGQALTVEPDHQRLDGWRYELEGRLAQLKRQHASLTRERDALEARLLRTRLERGEPILPPRYDLRVRRTPPSSA